MGAHLEVNKHTETHSLIRDIDIHTSKEDQAACVVLSYRNLAFVLAGQHARNEPKKENRKIYTRMRRPTERAREKQRERDRDEPLRGANKEGREKTSQIQNIR